ncbi:MAG: GNAT family N-acetyltransferase, partial [Myxococcota bacterium]
GVDPRFRRRGVGGALTSAAREWFAARVDRAFVKTQATNYGAVTLYERSGYTLHRTDLTYSATLGKPS